MADLVESSCDGHVAVLRLNRPEARTALSPQLVEALASELERLDSDPAARCVVIVASQTAVFGQPEIALGIIPGGGGTQRLARAVGKQRAMEYVLTGRRFDAKEARELGLVNEVVDAERWLEAAMELARTVAERPPIAIRLGKQAVLAAEETALSAGLENERRLYELAMATEDRVEGMKAFLEKREPRFEGR